MVVDMHTLPISMGIYRIGGWEWVFPSVERDYVVSVIYTLSGHTYKYKHTTMTGSNKTMDDPYMVLQFLFLVYLKSTV